MSNSGEWFLWLLDNNAVLLRISNNWLMAHEKEHLLFSCSISLSRGDDYEGRDMMEAEEKVICQVKCGKEKENLNIKERSVEKDWI